MSLAVRAASIGAAAFAVHAAVNSRALRRPPTPSDSVGERVSVLLPARDEATRIGPTLRALLAQTGVPRLEILVLDDGSTDATADVVRATAGDDPRVRLIEGGTEVPAGWLGKPWACARLADAAGPAATVLVFLDADVTVAPDGLARTVALLRDARLQLVSPYPRQLADGIGPRLVQPLLQWSWLSFLPLRAAEHSARESLAVANGQLLAVDADAYRTWGGHAAVRSDVIEDVALARAAKRHGYRATVADGTDIATCRMYDDWPALCEGYTKSLWAAFGSPAGATAVMSSLLALYVLPPAAAVSSLLRGRPRAAVVPLLGYAAGVAGRLVSARRTGGRSRDALAHPASIAVLAGLTARSWHARRTGTLTWRGRSLDAASTAR
ncbi:MAG TPA: glycosyltransferase family 2 protein [Mycobacteriales bacterium]|nr:glycosyltransferase family 2 protein [Mycobacteriales bacterium]